jgi:hypothetical protein
MRTMILGATALLLLLGGPRANAQGRGAKLSKLSLSGLIRTASQPRLHYTRAIRWQRPFVTKGMAQALVRKATVLDRQLSQRRGRPSTAAHDRVQTFINQAWVEDRSRPGGTPYFMHAVALDSGPHSHNIVVGDAARQVFIKAGYTAWRGETNGEVHARRRAAATPLLPPSIVPPPHSKGAR